MIPRIGIGFDVHALSAGGRLVIGGVTIPYTAGLAGHSDADVLLHAIVDALLGALALGDIGRHFPDSDAAYAGMDSRILVRRTMDLVTARAQLDGDAAAPRILICGSLYIAGKVLAQNG